MPRTQEILSLPLEENIGIYNFHVIATDSGGESQQDTLVMAVRQYQVMMMINDGDDGDNNDNDDM